MTQRNGVTHQDPVGEILANSYQCKKTHSLKKQPVLLKHLPHPSVGLEDSNDLPGCQRRLQDEAGGLWSVSGGMRRALVPGG